MTKHILSTSAFGVRPVCAALKVSPSGFYAHQQKDRRPRRREARVLAGELQSAFKQSLGRWEYFLAVVAVVSLLTALYFVSRVAEMNSRLNHAALIEHTGRGEDIAIIHRGEVMSEWEPRDGAIYQALDESLHEN